MIKQLRPYGDKILSGSTSSILASLYRQILEDLGVDQTNFNARMDRYIIKGYKEHTINDPSSKRGNLRTELQQDTMTWSVFVKGLHFLSVKSIDVIVKLYASETDTTTHKESALIASKETIPEDKTADKLLARLFHKTLFERNYSLVEFSKMMDAYIAKTSGPVNIRDVSSRKGNFKKELFKDKMSWNVFIKGLVLMNIPKFDIMVHLHHANGKVTAHGRSVILEE